MPTATSPQSPPPPSAPLRKQSLNLAQTAYLAHTTRRKLSSAASRADHDLRVLVGHANFLDSLLLELAEAHREQDRRPPPSPATASWGPQAVEEPKRRADVAATAVPDKPADDWEMWESDGSESDGSDSDSGEDRSGNGPATATALRVDGWVPRPGLPRSDALAVVTREVGEQDDDDRDGGDLGLVRILAHSPPEFLGNEFA